MQQAAAILLIAAGTAYTLTRPAFWKQGGAADQFADASDAMSGFYSEVKEKGFATSAKELTERLQGGNEGVATEGSDWQFVATPAVCTPPTPVVAEM